MIIVGLTGSIGMGKSTTAALFAKEGIPVYDADAAVHELYRGDAVAAVGKAFPGVIRDGVVDRQQLAGQLKTTPEALQRLEAIVHPLVRDKEKQFLKRHQLQGTDIVLLDIPLLFERGRIEDFDSIVVVTCDADIQRQRVLARPNMTEEKFRLIMARQTPDEAKRAKADFLIDTGQGLDTAASRVRDIVRALKAGRMSEKNDA
ncbi:dephospho-CoA kinase [Neorhizobium sp. NPDC001467]|uniref:dephospho-CoA kinase n=1 Tax=Neorhizobium sp. NPDC001467 TaxID=3390595 RepID=UPI003CFD4F85